MSKSSLRQTLMDEVEITLAGNMVDVELDSRNYELAVKKSLEKYRQLSVNSVEENYLFLQLEPHVTEYTLPEEIMHVDQIFRRTLGPIVGDGAAIDPFELAYTNMYLLANNQLGLATYEFYTQYVETVGKLMGLYVNYNYDPVTRRLTIFQHPKGRETLLLRVSMHRPDDILMQDHFAYPWLREWSLCEAKIMLGNAYRKVQNVPGPSGGTVLPGDQLIAEAREDMAELIENIKTYASGEQFGLSFIIG